jgi:AcrR family transcriptional regulator
LSPSDRYRAGVANRDTQTLAARNGRTRITRRDQLLGIAAEVFAARGFAGVTVDDLGAAAGVSGPALYHHFDSKEALLGEMLVRISQSLLVEARAAVAATSGVEVLSALIAMQVDFAVDNRALITVHFRDLVHASDADHRKVRELQNAYVDIWAEALADQRPGLSTRTTRAAVHATLGLINSTPFSGRLRRDEMVELLRRMAKGSLEAVR